MTLTAERRPTSRFDTERDTQPTLIWSGSNVALYGVIVALASLTAVVTWYVISGDSTWNAEVPSMDVAIFALVIASAAHISFLQAGRRAVGLRRRALLGEPAAEETGTAAPAFLDLTAITVHDLVGAPGLKHYHLSSCALAAGRGWPSADRGEFERAGKTPCGVCRP